MGLPDGRLSVGIGSGKYVICAGSCVSILSFVLETGNFSLYLKNIR